MQTPQIILKRFSEHAECACASVHICPLACKAPAQSRCFRKHLREEASRARAPVGLESPQNTREAQRHSLQSFPLQALQEALECRSRSLSGRGTEARAYAATPCPELPAQLEVCQLL